MTRKPRVEQFRECRSEVFVDKLRVRNWPYPKLRLSPSDYVKR